MYEKKKQKQKNNLKLYKLEIVNKNSVNGLSFYKL